MCYPEITMIDPLPFRVIYENMHILAVEKPAGMVTHPVYKHPDGTLVDYVAAWRAERGLSRPWLLHRLDKPTSGVLLFAGSEHMLRIGARQFEQHTVAKRYLALVWGADLPDEGMIDAPLRRDPEDRRRVIVREDGKAAQTRYEVLERRGNHALVRLRPVTGRMHQLRAHLESIGHPMCGDEVYAPDHAPFSRLMLHAEAITIQMPTWGGARARTFLAPIPADFATALECGA
jgi:23S rRNA pseudouridine1911/1915/1917 synthase